MRNNVQDNFEEVYLRINMARKAFANPEAVSKLMSDPDFERCVRHVANLTFRKNSAVLLRHGFDGEDMISIARTIGVQFVNNKFDGGRKDRAYILMRFISQKMENFMIFLDRKFRINERHADVYLEEAGRSGGMAADALLVYQGERIPSPLLGDEPSSVHVKISNLKGEVSRLKSMIMQSRLNHGIDLHADRLAEIATSKLVDFSVRKRARHVCRKNGIDYVQWAMNQIRANDLNEGDFILK